MKLYLAGGFPIMSMRGVERGLYNKFPVWRRLVSFHYVWYLNRSELLLIKYEELKNTKDEN